MRKEVISNPLKYSIIIPVYFNEGTLHSTMETLRRDVLAAHSEWSHEIIFVDDGSGDDSLRVLLDIRARDPEHVKVIRLTRNFGQVFAIIAGFSYATGECVLNISADQQDPPSIVNDMLHGYFMEKYEVVIAKRTEREESAYRVLTSRFFYWLVRKLCFASMPPGGFDTVLLGPRARKAFLKEKDPHPFFQGKILWTGYRTKMFGYRRVNRKVGKSRWTLAKKMTFLIDGILSYSYSPIRFMSGVGILISLAGFGYSGAVFIDRLFFGNDVKGWAPLMIVVLILGGFQLLMLGVVGEYVWRTLAQVREREQFIIDEIYDDTVTKENPANIPLLGRK